MLMCSSVFMCLEHDVDSLRLTRALNPVYNDLHDATQLNSTSCRVVQVAINMRRDVKLIVELCRYKQRALLGDCWKDIFSRGCGT